MDAAETATQSLPLARDFCRTGFLSSEILKHSDGSVRNAYEYRYFANVPVPDNAIGGNLIAAFGPRGCQLVG